MGAVLGHCVVICHQAIGSECSQRLFKDFQEVDYYTLVNGPQAATWGTRRVKRERSGERDPGACLTFKGHEQDNVCHLISRPSEEGTLKEIIF